MSEKSLQELLMTGTIGTALADKQDPAMYSTFMPRKPPLAETKPAALSSHGAGEKRLVIAYGRNSAKTSRAQEEAMQQQRMGKPMSKVEQKKQQDQDAHAKVQQALQEALNICASPLVK